MNLRGFGWTRALRGLREGNQAVLLTGLALVLLQRMRGSRRERQLVYRKRLPVGSTLVVRHAQKGGPRVEIRQAELDQTR